MILNQLFIILTLFSPRLVQYHLIDGTASTMGVDVSGSGVYQSIAVVEDAVELTDKSALLTSGLLSHSGSLIKQS